MRNSIDDVLAQVHANPDPIHLLLTKAKDNKSYICPFCNNGNSGKSGDGINLSKDGKFYCFKCNAKGDAIDLYRQIKGISSFSTAIAEVAALYNIPFSCKNYNHPTNLTPEEKIRYINDLATLDIAKAAKNTNHPDYLKYLKERAITPQTAKLFNLGFLSNWRHPKNLADNKQSPASPRLIIPTGENSYTARDIRDSKTLSIENQKYIKQKVNVAGIFNSKVLTTSNKPIFIVEGELDAISIYEAGGVAIALGSTSNTDKLLSILPKYQKELYILALDNDIAGQKASEYLSKAFSERKLKFCVKNVFGQYKDANEALQKDKANFIKSVQAAQCTQLDNQTCYSFLDKVTTSLQNHKKTITTPFDNLNKILDGSLNKGVYFLTSQLGTGKESFLVNIARSCAKDNHPCIIYSLNRNYQEIMAQFLTCEYNNLQEDFQNYITVNRLLNSFNEEINSALKKDSFTKALNNFAIYSKNLTLYTLEQNENILTLFEEQIKKFILLKKLSPLVIFNIPGIYFSKYNEKYPAGDLIYKIKNLSSKYNLPILIITDIVYPMHKNSYSFDNKDMLNFLFYGSIGAAADYILGLQFVNAPIFSNSLNNNSSMTENDIRKSSNRKVEIIVLKAPCFKNYNSCSFTYNALTSSITSI